MAIRTINSPGIEITENDLSEYSSGDNGTHVLVAGFAPKGENYTDTLVATQRAFLANFGEPRNEAERYFYTACMEVLNQGGTLHACKLPYDNDSLDKCVAKTYTVNSPATEILTVGQYMDEASNETVDFSDILIGDFSEFSNLPDYANIKTLQNIDNIYDTAITLNSANTERAQITTFSYAYLTDAELGLLNIAGSSEDNIRKESGENIYTRLSAMFSPTSTFRKKLAEGVISGTDGQPIISIDYAGVFDENGSVADNINKFKECVLSAFGGDDTTSIFENACNPETANATAIYAEFPNFATSDLMKFITANKRLFGQIKQIDAGTDDSVFKKQLPYFYWDNADSIFNAGVYYIAIKYIENKQSAQELYDSIDACKLANDVIDLRKVLTENTTINIDNINSFLSRITKLSGGDEYYTDSYTNLKTSFTNTTKTKLTTPLQDLLDGLESVKNDEDFQNIIDNTKFGTYVSTPFAEGMIDYYIHHTAISNAFHRRTIQKSTDLNIFLERKFSLNDVFDFIAGTSTLFELYTTYADDGTLINSIETLKDAYLKTLNVTEFADLLDEFKTYDTYSMLTDYAEENNTEFNQSVIQHIDGKYAVTKLIFSDVHQLDNSITRVLNINSSDDVSLMDMSTIDAYATGEEEPTDGSFVIVDKTFNTLKRAYAKDAKTNVQKELLGIMPVVTTATNAFVVQQLIDTNGRTATQYNAVAGARTMANCDVGAYDILSSDSAIPLGLDANSTTYSTSVSTIAANTFPTITFDSDGRIDRDQLKRIGIVVFEIYNDTTNGNKLNFNVLESFIGSLDKNAVNPTTGATDFIDNIVNNQSNYIQIFSNCFRSAGSKATYSSTDMISISNQTAGILGFYEYMSEPAISLAKSINYGLAKIFDANADINEKQIDIVCDAGISNIAQYTKTIFNEGKGEFDPTSTYSAIVKLTGTESVATWKSTINLFDNFCKNIRKDCMFVSDAPRFFCLEGNRKIIRTSKPDNTIDTAIIPKLKYISGINTNYGAGYCNWFQVYDETSGNNFWCPPSIKAMGVYLYVDTNHDFWEAPAGLNRGTIGTALDVAFNPSQVHADQIYPKSWNYARHYSDEGVVLEGQKTFQTKETALDRVAARRALLRFERRVYQISRYFVYEINNTQNRQRYYDALDGMFKEYKAQGALYDYHIICDETLNTEEVIDRNELRCKIGVKLNKFMEFILVEFNVLRTAGSWEEML